jgi:Zn-dependent M28 family amino/carboxypeptidase
VVWTFEPPYADPDAALLADAERWRKGVDSAAIRRLVERLPGPRGRLHAPEAMVRADELITGAWARAGWTVERQELHLRDVRAWPDRRYPRLDGVNLVATLAGETREAIVIVAHHDTVPGSPGADDNGSGVVALMELARLLAGRRYRRSVVLAAPDFEELGMIGSRHLVPWLQERHVVRGAIVFDPIGFMDPAPGSQSLPGGIGLLYPGQMRRLRERDNAGDMVLAIYRRSSRRLARSWARSLAATIGRERVVLLRDPADLPPFGSLALLVPVVRNFSRSDHLSFWRAGIPAIQVTDTANYRNPNYHRPGDLPNTLDYETLRGIVAATALLIERLAS